MKAAFSVSSFLNSNALGRSSLMSPVNKKCCISKIYLCLSIQSIEDESAVGGNLAWLHYSNWFQKEQKMQMKNELSDEIWIAA